MSRLENVTGVEVDLAGGTMTVAFGEGALDVAAVREAVRGTGHGLVIGRRPREGRGVGGFVRFLLSQRNTTLTAAAGALTLVGLALTLLGAAAVARVCFGVAIAVGGWPIAQLAWGEVARRRALGINTLMVIAVTGAMVIGEWAEGAIVVVLFALGEALEGYASDRARSTLEGLLDLAPPVALRMGPGGGLQEVAVEALAAGERVLVRPGDRVTRCMRGR